MNSKTLLRFIAYAIIGTAMIMPLLVLPAMVGTLVDEAGMTESYAGWVASINFAGGAMTGLYMAFRMHGLDLRKVATIALLMVILLEVCSALAVAPNPLFLALRFLSGIAAGAASTAAVASFARHTDAERGFGIFITLQFIVSGVGLYVLPVYSPQLGASGMYFLFAAIGALALLCTGLLPRHADAHRNSTTASSERGVLLSIVTIAAMLGYCLFEIALSAQFTYVERLAVGIDLSDAQTGTALLIASLVGIPGAFTIVLIGHRFGRIVPLSFGTMIAISGLVLLIRADDYASYFLGSCFMGFSWAFCLPYIQSLLASLDRHGSAIAAGSALATVGGAAGPGIAAMIVAASSYKHVFLFSIAVFVVTICSFAFVEHRAPYSNEKIIL